MLVRCERHRSERYRYSLKPVGYPNTAAICGRCNQPGYVLLNQAEIDQAKAGQNIFSFNSNVMKVQVELPLEIPLITRLAIRFPKRK